MKGYSAYITFSRSDSYGDKTPHYEIQLTNVADRMMLARDFVKEVDYFWNSIGKEQNMKVVNTCFYGLDDEGKTHTDDFLASTIMEGVKKIMKDS